jgi:predicted molibdopterin-dependent oxidoreductase YjgC
VIAKTGEVTVDGVKVEFGQGETLLDVSNRLGRHVPTLCHDERLAPAGACRTCLVEVEGVRRMVPACRTPASDGQKVTTANERIDKHRRLLLGLYLTDHPAGRSDCEDGAPCELHAMAANYEAPTDWTPIPLTRAGRSEDVNPYIQFREDRCIACARCTRYCDEVEGVNAITLAGRGAATTISTVDSEGLFDTTCELCGGCVAVCPTGAMAEKMPLTAGAPPERELQKVRTTCNYCGVGCQMDLNVDTQASDGKGQVVKITSPPPGTPPSDGNLCVKGRFAYDFVDHPDRLKVPLIRREDGELHEASWEEALEFAAKGLLRVQQDHGKDALAFVSSSRCTAEENYLVQKMARVAFGTNNVHQCAAT